MGTVLGERAQRRGELVAMPGSCGGTMEIRTSETDPIRVDFLPRAVHGLVGDIGLTIAPGKQDVANGWLRDMGMDMTRLRTVFRTDCLVSLLDASEFAALGISELDTFAVANGIRPVLFPIPDMHPPHERDRDAFIALIEGIISGASAGQNVVIHCRAGIGRSGLVAASVLVARGLSAPHAIEVVREVRSPRSVETSEQRAWVQGLEGVFNLDVARCECI
ncbi:MAG: protein phosphatase [Chloroflexi bacterium]|nr:protein phosphatase [Chloroflexota bacterium]